MPITWQPLTFTAAATTTTTWWTPATSIATTASTILLTPQWPGTTGGAGGYVGWGRAPLRPAPQLSEAERARLARERENAGQRRQARRAVRTVAQEKAAALLLAVLPPDEAARYQRERVFEVRGSLGGRYRIRPGNAGNVDALNETGEVTGRLCAHPRLWESGDQLPDADVALAQLLALTTDEAHFVRTANVHWGRRPPLAVAA